MSEVLTLDRLIENRERTLARVRQVLITRLRIDRDPEDIDPDVPLFGTGLGLDSVDAVELVVSLEKEFGCKFPEIAHAQRVLRTVNTLVDLVIAMAAGEAERGRTAHVPAGVPRHYDASFAAELTALRTSTVWLENRHTVALRLTGSGAFDVLDRACTTDLFLQDAQMRPTLLLREDGLVFADACVCRDEDGYILLAEGPSADELIAHLAAVAPPGTTCEMLDLSIQNQLLSIHGPYAWELLGEWLGAELVGLPYLTLFRTPDALCFRSGKTGEYGYDVLLAKQDAPRLRERLVEHAAAFDLAPISLAALDHAALENWFYCIRHDGATKLTPRELGLQWRLSPRKKYVGAAALAAGKGASGARRVVCATASSELRPGESIVYGDLPIGSVLEAAYSPLRRDWVARLLLNAAYGVPGVDEYEARRGAESVPVHTVSPPVLDNRSLYVSPQRHSFATRAEDGFPPIA